MSFSSEVVVFILYLVFMLGVGVFFFIRQKRASEKTFFLGDRKMGAWVTALSAGASDMSAWVLMGLPTSIYAAGMGQMWCPIGLLLGYALSWFLVAPRLRKFSIVANDSITIPQYLTNRFLSGSKILQIVCAAVFLIAYTVYAATSVKACGILFNKVIGWDTQTAMLIGALIIVGYTFLGGFSAVCWTDFFQGLLILGAMLIAPIFAVTTMEASSAGTLQNSGDFWNMFSDWRSIVSGLAWGFGYFGMPHIIIRFMSLKSQKELKKSRVIGISWTALILLFAAVIGIVGKLYLRGDEAYLEGVVANELVFIEMVREIFKNAHIIVGVLLAAVLAASMSTADSQLLAASSSFAADVYQPVFRKNKASGKEMLWIGRCVVLVVAVVAFFMARSPKAGSIMDMVGNAWGLFGAAFGPVILLSLMWKRFNFAGAVAGIVGGAAADILWLTFLLETFTEKNEAGQIISRICVYDTGVYELFPGFIVGLLAAVIVTLCTKAPGKDVEALFDRAVAYEDE